MQGLWLKRIVAGLIAILIVGGVIWFAWPRPVPVDLATATRGPMEVTVDEEAKTRVRHIYTVSAPVIGKVLRISGAGPAIHTIHVGDQVTANQTVVAVMQPTTPGFIDARSREELRAAAGATEASVKLAEAEIKRSEAALQFSLEELRRAETLVRTDAVSTRAVEKAKLDVQTSEAALASAKAQLEMRRNEHASATARLIDPSTLSSDPAAECCIELRAPISGRILKIVQESEAVVSAGAPLVEIGDPLDLEIVAELLSTDAVQVKTGALVEIDGWGGNPLRGRVTRVDPAGFVKVSALGIEEQRVRTIIDIENPPEQWVRLGHDYRVIVHIAVWSAQDVLTVPVSALFRIAGEWAVFAVKDGRVRSTPVQVGQRNSRVAEIFSGLSEGEPVVLHPSDRIKDGTTVARRQMAQ